MSIFNLFPRLETERLILRDLRNADRAAIFRIYSDEVIADFTPFVRAETVSDAEAIISSIRNIYRQRRGILWGVSPRDSGTAIGTCGFLQWYRDGMDAHRAEFGFVLARPYWRQGYMREACTRALRFGFKAMELNRVEVNVTPNNDTAITFLQTLGFVHEGRLRQRKVWGGEFRDVEHLALLRDDWAAAG